MVVNTWKEEISKNTFWNQATALTHKTKPVDVGWGNWKSWRQVFAVTGQVTRSDRIRDGSTENCAPLRSSNMRYRLLSDHGNISDIFLVGVFSIVFSTRVVWYQAHFSTSIYLHAIKVTINMWGFEIVLAKVLLVPGKVSLVEISPKRVEGNLI